MKKRNQIFNICNLYILIWCIYNFHWYATKEFPIVENLSNVLLAINLGISIVAAIKVNVQPRVPKILKVANVLIAMFIVYGIANVLMGDSLQVSHSGTSIRSGSYLIGPLRTFLPMYTFYLFAQMGYVNEKIMRWWFPVFLVTAIHFFYYELYMMRGGSFDELLTNNNGYLFYTLFPFVFLFNRSWIQYAIAALLTLLTFMSLKRGAILATGICLVYFLYFKLSKVRRRDMAGIVLFTMVFLYLGFMQVVRIYNDSATLQYRFEQTAEGNDSGRSSIRDNLIDIYTTQSSFFELVFGYGGNATLRYGENYAHNDWLEMIFDMGLIGLFVFGVFWYQFFKLWRKSKPIPLVYMILGMMFLSQFAKSVFSMWYSDMPVFTVLLIGFCLAKIYDPQSKMLSKTM